MAVRNADGGFYLCQSQQNIYRTSKKIRIQWLGEAPKESSDAETLYAPEYYDRTEFETILTSVDLQKKNVASEDKDKEEGKPKKRGRTAAAADKRRFGLAKGELERVERLLQRSVDKEAGKAPADAELSEDNPDGREFVKVQQINNYHDSCTKIPLSLCSGHLNLQGRGPAEGTGEKEKAAGEGKGQGRQEEKGIIEVDVVISNVS